MHQLTTAGSVAPASLATSLASLTRGGSGGSGSDRRRLLFLASQLLPLSLSPPPISTSSSSSSASIGRSRLRPGAKRRLRRRRVGLQRWRRLVPNMAWDPNSARLRADGARLRNAKRARPRLPSNVRISHDDRDALDAPPCVAIIENECAALSASHGDGRRGQARTARGARGSV